MTTEKYTEIEKELLEVCKYYMQVVQCTPSQLVEELLSGASQTVETHAYQLTKYMKKIEVVTPSSKNS